MAHKVFGSDDFQNGVNAPYCDIEEHCPHCDEVLPILIDFDQIHHFYVTCPTCGGRVLLCSLCEENCDQRDGVCQMSDPATNLRRLWAELGDIPINDRDEIEEPFLHFERGTDRFEIWHWFDDRYPGGVVALMQYNERDEQKAKKSVYELPKMVTDNPNGNFEVMLNLVYGKDGWSYIRHGEMDMPITDFCFKKLCPEFGCPAVAKIPMTNEEQDELLFDCVFDNCPVATVYAALSGYGHLRDRLRKHEDAMTNRVLTLEEVKAYCEGGADATPLWYDEKERSVSRWMVIDLPELTFGSTATVKRLVNSQFFEPTYGEKWRCWLRKPTKEEMEAALWEE